MHVTCIYAKTCSLGPLTWVLNKPGSPRLDVWRSLDGVRTGTVRSVQFDDCKTLMRILTLKVFLFITNIPEDLDGIDEGYLEKEINELNQKAFVIVIFVHPMADDELRTIPYR